MTDGPPPYEDDLRDSMLHGSLLELASDLEIPALPYAGIRRRGGWRTLRRRSAVVAAAAAIACAAVPVGLHWGTGGSGHPGAASGGVEVRSSRIEFPAPDLAPNGLPEGEFHGVHWTMKDVLFREDDPASIVRITQDPLYCEQFKPVVDGKYVAVANGGSCTDDPNDRYSNVGGDNLVLRNPADPKSPVLGDVVIGHVLNAGGGVTATWAGGSLTVGTFTAPGRPGAFFAIPVELPTSAPTTIDVTVRYTDAYGVVDSPVTVTAGWFVKR